MDSWDIGSWDMGSWDIGSWETGSWDISSWDMGTHQQHTFSGMQSCKSQKWSDLLKWITSLYVWCINNNNNIDNIDKTNYFGISGGVDSTVPSQRVSFFWPEVTFSRHLGTLTRHLGTRLLGTFQLFQRHRSRRGADARKVRLCQISGQNPRSRLGWGGCVQVGLLPVLIQASTRTFVV